MDSGPQAYGLGRSSGQVDAQQFLKTKLVLVRLICLKFSIIAYFCIQPGSKIKSKQSGHDDLCVFNPEKESTCYVGIQVTLIGIVASIVFICTEYFMWKSSSIKHRRRIVRSAMIAGGVECFFCFVAFLYIFFTWIGNNNTDTNISSTNPNFAIIFLFFDILSWGYFTLMEYQRFEKGVDPEFLSSFGGEDSAQFSAYAVEENDCQDNNIEK